MKKYRNKRKIGYIICLFFVGVLSQIQGAEHILRDGKKKDDDYKPLVNLFKFSALGLEVIKYIDCEGEDGRKALLWSVGLGHLDCAKYVVNPEVFN